MDSRVYISFTEMGSSSVTKAPLTGSSSPNSSGELLNGLKFGQKIYFEDVGVGAPVKSGASGGSSSSGATPTKKGRGGAVQGAQPPRCQVEGCKVDLTDAKAYYSRHKVCGMHSKSPRVIVAGLEQRFCQQCSRFHLLPEFDKEKRSCRRRLAGHNERRRKPPSSSLLTSRFGRLSSPIFDNGGRVGGFLMEFSSYPKLTMRNEMSTPRSSEQVAVYRTSTPPWQGSLETPSELFLRSSESGISYPHPRNPPGENFTRITDSSCALSLLSNQTWGPRNRAPNLGVNNLYSSGTPMTQLAPSSHGAAIHQLSNPSWCFKGNEAGNCSHEQPLDTQLPGELLVPQPDRRQYMDLEQYRACESSHLMHWSL